MAFSLSFLREIRRSGLLRQSKHGAIAAFLMTAPSANTGRSRYSTLFLPVEKLLELAEARELTGAWYLLHGTPFEHPWILAFAGAIKRNRRHCIIRSPVEPVAQLIHTLTSLRVDVVQIELPAGPLREDVRAMLGSIVCRRDSTRLPRVEVVIRAGS